MADAGDAPPWWLSYAAGSIGGCSGVVVGHPFDTVKVRMITGAGAVAGSAEARRFSSGALATTRATIGKEGWLALYKGLATPAIGNAGICGLLFGAYGGALRYLEGGEVGETPSLTNVVLAGEVAGIVQLPVAAMAEHTKILVQNQLEAGAGAQYRGSIDCALQIWRHNPRGLLKGLCGTCCRDVFPSVGYGIYYGSYETIRRLFVAEGPDGKRTFSPLSTIGAGSIAGAISWTWIYPVDVVKTRVQSVPFRYIRIPAPAVHSFP